MTKLLITEKFSAAAEIKLKASGLFHVERLKPEANLSDQISDIDFIIVATITPDMFFPSTACNIQTKLLIQFANARGASDINLGQIVADYIQSDKNHTAPFQFRADLGCNPAVTPAETPTVPRAPPPSG